MRFVVGEEQAVFAESVRAGIADWEPPREPPLGAFWDEADDGLRLRLEAVGWSELWDPELRAACVAGAVELGRALAPLSLLDIATLGAPLAVEGRARHACDADAVARIARGNLRLASVETSNPEASLDGIGTTRLTTGDATTPDDGGDRLAAWGAATLGYLAGLTTQALETTIAYVRSREQFGAPLAALPTLQARLADAALAVDGIELVAWAAAGERRFPAEELTWASSAAREVTLSAHQAHGGVGFALESGVHRAYRRAKSVQVWAAAVCRALVDGPAPG